MGIRTRTGENIHARLCAKDLILADRDEEGMAEQLTKCGVYVDQDETFYVEPKKEQETA